MTGSETFSKGKGPSGKAIFATLIFTAQHMPKNGRHAKRNHNDGSPQRPIIKAKSKTGMGGQNPTPHVAIPKGIKGGGNTGCDNGKNKWKEQQKGLDFFEVRLFPSPHNDEKIKDRQGSIVERGAHTHLTQKALGIASRCRATGQIDSHRVLGDGKGSQDYIDGRQNIPEGKTQNDSVKDSTTTSWTPQDVTDNVERSRDPDMRRRRRDEAKICELVLE